MHFLGRTQTLNELSIENCLEKLKHAGFDGVELCLEHPDIAPDKLTSGRLQELAKLALEQGLAPNSLSYHANYIYEDKHFEEIQQVIELTHEFDTNVLVIGGSPKRSNDCEEWDRMIKRTRELAHIAEVNRITLAKEFEPDFIVGNTVDLLWMFEQINSDYLQANLDLGHVFLCDANPIEAILSLEGKIAHCHIEDMGTGIHKHLVPGEGDMNFSAYFAALKEIKFDGMLGLDLYDLDYLSVAPDALKHLRVASAGGGCE